MAILRGFPPSNTISPSVRIAEKDLSFIAPEQTLHRAALIGFASKGPINIPTIIATSRQLHRTFGNPHPQSGDPYLLYAAEQYLLIANELYVIRVADTDPVSDESATLAEVDVPAAGTVIEIESDEPGPYDFTGLGTHFFRWRLNGVLSERTLVVFEDNPLTSGPTYTTAELVAALNDQIDAENDGIEFYANLTNCISVRTLWAYGPEAELEFVSVQNAIYGGSVADGNVTGFGQAMEVASTMGGLDKFPDVGYQTPGHYEFPNSVTGLNLNIVVDGTDNVLIDNVVQSIDLSSLESQMNIIGDIVDVINAQRSSEGGDLPGGWVASAAGEDGFNLVFSTLSHGRDARLRIKSDSTAIAIFDFDSATAIGVTPPGVTGDPAIETFGRVNGDSNTGGDVSFTVKADSVGIEGNLTQVVIKNNTRESSFNVEIYSNGSQVESWGNITKNDASTFYVGSYFALVSEYINIEDNTAIQAGPADGTYDLVGGSDGIPSDPDKQDELLIGNSTAYTGIYTVSESEQFDIDLIAVPGHTSTTVVTELLYMCQNFRMDCMAIIDSPFGLTVNEIIAWQNGTHPLNSTRFDSDFGALYWPWVRLRDNYNRVDVWAPPSGSVMAVYAQNDRLARPLFAPAGLNRGMVPGINDVYARPTQEERDLMYGYRNCINPIVQFADTDGFCVWGQKTMQRRPTALDRVNVRRLMFYIEKQLKARSRGLLFEPHDEILRAEFIRIADVVLQEVLIGRGVTGYKIQCDEVLNTSDVIDRNELRARIGVIPTRAVEFIFLEFSIHRTGSNFTESTNAF
jgi:hypothetical protein